MKRVGLYRTIFEIILVMIIIVLTVYRFTPKLQTWYTNVVQYVPIKEKLVALTYDDGPHPVYTPEILDILDKYNVKATFFLIGNQMEKHPEIVEEILQKGHVIGNHTFTHPANIETDSTAQVIRELESCEQLIERLSGDRAYLFRPPKGLIDSTVFNIAREEGYRTILWTVSADHHDAPTPELMAKRVVRLIRPGGIILAHDGTFNSRWKDVAATPLIIEALLKQGYRFVTIPELLEKGEKVKFKPGQGRGGKKLF